LEIFMKFKFAALALGAISVLPAVAQPTVTVYGRVSMGFQSLSNDNKGILINQESSSRLGFRGTEDLGGGLKAFFQLENRFFPDTGTIDPDGSNLLFKDKAWVGLSGNFGAVYLGRNFSPSFALYGGGGATTGGFDAFGGDTIGTFPARRGRIANLWDNSIRYDSPQLGPVQVIAGLSLSEIAAGGKNAYGIGFKFDSGPLRGDLVYQHDVTDNGGGTPILGTGGGNVGGTGRMFNTVNATVGYDLGPAYVYSGYASSKGYDVGTIRNSKTRFNRFQVGAKVAVGKGAVLMNLGKGTNTNAAGVAQPEFRHIGLGYWHILSNRTTLMANTKFERQKRGFNTRNKQDGIELAVRHNF
jgi:predicted porin